VEVVKLQEFYEVPVYPTIGIPLSDQIQYLGQAAEPKSRGYAVVRHRP
jgi:hypothetical protein